MDKQDRFDIIVYFITTYGVCWIIGILNYQRHFLSGEAMASFMMILPATGVSIANLYKNKHNNKNRKIHLLYVSYFLASLLFILLRMSGILSSTFIESIWLSNAISVVSLLCFLMAALGDNENLIPFANINKVKKVLIIFVITLLISGGIQIIPKGTPYGHSAVSQGIGAENVNYSAIVSLPLFLPLIIISSAAMGFGEEYGWRGFLQPKMQRKFGKRTGVILLGIIWELWHMPLWLDPYQVDVPGLVLRLFSTTSLAVVIGYAWMKSGNVWICAAMHLTFNTIFTVFSETGMGGLNAESLTASKIIGCIFYIVVFFSFLFTKEYRNESFITGAGKA